MNYKTGSAFEFMRRMWARVGQRSVDPYLTLQNAVDPFFDRLLHFQTTVVIQPGEMFLAAGNTLKHVSIGLVQRIVPTMVSAASADYSQPDALARDGQQNPSLTLRVMKCSLLWNRYAQVQSQKYFATKTR